MADFTFTVDSDFSKVFADLAKVSQGARQAGDTLGKGLSDGLATANANIAALSAQIKTLITTRSKLQVDSSEYRSVQQQIDTLQGKLAQARGEKLKLQADASAVTAAATEIGKLGPAAQRAGADVSKGIGDRLKEVDARIAAVLQEIGRLSSQKAQLKVDSAEFVQAEAKATELKQELNRLNAERVTLKADATDITAKIAAITRELQAVNDRKARLNVDSSEFKQAEAQARALEAQLAQLEAEKIQIPIDVDAPRQAADGFRLLDGVVQGVAFSLSNAVVNSAGQALQAVQGLIDGYARLDTELRKAAAADGGVGAYEKLAATIDKVGIDAAGTQQQVAELTTELVRGGLTADQVTQSLGGIVRGAEATATAYDRMGQIVSATLTAFGLQASETTRVVDALVQGANSSATDVSGLGEAFKTSAPAAKLLGISVEGLATAVGLFTNAGITAGEAGTTLRNGLSQLGSAAPQTGAGMQKLTGQAKEAADVMKKLKLDIYNANGTLKPMETVLLQLKGAFDKLGPAARIQLASKLFGGTDDGTKWLAVLSQSEEKIKAMATAMAGAKGATDRNRDAMQGFQLTMQQLTGTLDSLGNNVGRIAAGALLPLVNAANTLVGAVAGLPAPVKDTVIALGLLTGGVVAATTAYVVFQRVLQMEMTTAAIAGTLDLGRAIGTTLVSGIGAAVRAIPALLTQLALIGQINVGQAIGAIATALKTTFLNGVSAASRGLLSFLLTLQSVSFSSFIAGVRSTTVALGPLALAAGAVTAAVVVWQKVLEGAGKASEEFSASQKAVGDAMAKLGTDLVQTAQKAKEANAGFLGLGEVFRNAKEGWTLIRLVDETKRLDEGFNQVFDSAMKFFGELKNSKDITEEQKKKAKEYVEQLKAISAAYRTQAERAKVLAVEEARLGNADTAKFYDSLVRKLGANANALDNLRAGFERQTGAQAAASNATQRNATLTEQQIKLNKERALTEQELNKIIAAAPLRNTEAQLAVGQQLLSLAQAIGQAEQSRYGVTRSALNFELQKAQERNASETQIKGIKDQITANDRAALQSRYQMMRQEQALQIAMLGLTQEKARLEANQSVLQQRVELLKANYALDEARAKNDAVAEAKALGDLKIQQQILGIKQSAVNLLAQTQPLEVAALGYQQEAARNGLQSEAAAIGYRIALDGSLQKASLFAQLQGRIGSITTSNAAEQERYTRLAEQSGIAVGKAADGTVVLGRTQADVNKAVAEMNKQISSSKGSFDAAGKGAAGVKGAVDGIRTGLGNAQNPANALAGAFAKTGDRAPAIAQGSRDFAAYLSKAGGFTTAIANLNLDRRMATVASSTRDAATAAQTFYSALKNAAALPGSRWTGGPVEAGGEYRINELGQEAFLSAGRLSLINAAPNSIWRAPSEGVVIPAGITARLQAQGAMQPAGGSAVGTAELAIEVGKLRQEVGNLARRDWSVRVTQRTGPTGSQVMRTLLS